MQLVLGITQQVALVPVFLHFWTGETLAAWLAICAAGNLVLVADAGLQLRAINRFLSFKRIDSDGRTAGFYAAMSRTYFMLTGLLIAAVLGAAWLFSPSEVLGFRATSHFDAAFIVMTIGMPLVLPSNLPSGLYRARSYYGRALWMQCGAMLIGQLGQLIAVAAVKCHAGTLVRAVGLLSFRHQRGTLDFSSIGSSVGTG